MKNIVIFILIIVTSSCAPSGIIGTYNRTFEISTAAMTSTKKQKLIINRDSTVTWIDYKNEFSQGDSSLTYGVITAKSHSLFILKDTIGHKKYCLLKKGQKLFFYKCNIGKGYRFPNPFIKDHLSNSQK